MDTDEADFYERTQFLLGKYPEIAAAIAWDLDRHGLTKKRMRLAEKAEREAWERRGSGQLLDLPEPDGSADL